MTDDRSYSRLPLSLGGYYDVEANTREGDAAFLQRVPLPSGKDLESLPGKFFSSAVLQVRSPHIPTSLGPGASTALPRRALSSPNCLS